MTPHLLCGERAGTLMLSWGINIAHRKVLHDLIHVFVIKETRNSSYLQNKEHSCVTKIGVHKLFSSLRQNTNEMFYILF